MVRDDWINTSVEDLRATLMCVEQSGKLPAIADDLMDTLVAVTERPGHATREKLLRSFGKRADKMARQGEKPC